ncbi:MAG: 23S rRNA (adenine(2503)-C(2))-methyltransferase RlmN [Deltaproteobacteria bacterium]|nr:23S rRNA (adenine(2503)-C(2))-methyltransferase RlmN [Deltaproteobacteria bacterium]
MSMEDIEIISLEPDKLKKLLKENAIPQYRGEQLFDWIHRRYVTKLSEMNNLPKDFINLLGGTDRDLCPVTAGEVFTSSDKTRKMEILLKDGLKVETVLIPENGKLTQCISSQVGCSVGCEFCRSGKFGFKRNLTAGEILGQIFAAREFYFPDEHLTNVVFMGIGEPFHNYDNVLNAYQLICNPKGIGLSSRKVTISTAGITKGIEKLGIDTDGKAALAISLHAATEDVRKKLVPGMKTTLEEIVKALKNYPLPQRRRFTIEYVMVKGVNDSDQDARALVRLLSTLRVKINLLPLNEHDLSDLQTPDEERVLAFTRILTDKGLSVFMRKKRGNDINAACGQLLGEKSK